MGHWWALPFIQNGQAILLVAWIFWVLLSITLHELGHGYAAVWQGDDTPIQLRRLTLSPFVHIPPIALILFAIMGITWGAMPVNPSRFRTRRWGELMVSAAGPLVNLILAGLIMIAAGVFDAYAPQTDWSNDVYAALVIGSGLNMILFLFNLLPIPPLDGSTILSKLSLRYDELLRHEHAQVFGLLFVMLIIFTGVAGYAFEWVWDVARAGAGVVTSMMP